MGHGAWGMERISYSHCPMCNYPFEVRGCASSRHPRRQMLRLGKPRQVLQVGGALRQSLMGGTTAGATTGGTPATHCLPLALASPKGRRPRCLTNALAHQLPITYYLLPITKLQLAIFYHF
ncbi:hypothetical protein [Tolypothrix sp. VBCCA 56010]|uniref:hypothetical protein n=1 Tax=Tolypothrix sp. VBCCA 56010 TaxID=3137731 RepID=UPI003D7D4031